MKVLVIGQGGREHALVWKFKESPKVSKVYCAPGNGGIAAIAELVKYAENQFEELIHFVQEKQIDLVFVGPENPLTEGIVDRFQEAGIKAYGPNKAAAIIEGSKTFAKDLMKKNNIPTAAYKVFTEEEEAISYLDSQQAPIVIKADGLAAGKGVTVAQTINEAKEAVRFMMSGAKFGEAGHQVVIEECLVGEELSLMAFVDGEVVIPMVPAQDHKPVYDEDKGPNTGGMGAYSPVPHMGIEQVEKAVEEILIPTAKAMVKEGRPFTGILYAGLMMTKDGAKVIEFNARFGDPETQVILPRLQTDIVDIVEASLSHKLDQIEVLWNPDTAVTVVLASEGYPGEYPKGVEIYGTDTFNDAADVLIFHAGTSIHEDKVVTSGGRVLAITGIGRSVIEAREKAYAAIKEVGFKGMHFRTDIAAKALRS